MKKNRRNEMMVRYSNRGYETIEKANKRELLRKKERGYQETKITDGSMRVHSD